ncbi:thiamine-phosphate pyrophosphorylase [Halarchaeum rubridurum]|uniref:Thiamine-phosphate synthase n=1 Tax=Halarchaeum rubridurum TaxID=489911 RepID=A0A830FYU0_9EURY|nr:thiamine phosphate synthase [Halarchaeum rubridurum]MBP1954534.1 thiamine-phosphate pyrophosphorylase [Halarchaeum rubridurum]GGM61885.1 thiamine-phosphate synthase [Halarchaeum rubridurum]
MNSEFGTYLVTQGSRSRGRTTEDVVAAAITGGVDVVQLREKGATARERYHLGRALREQTREADVTYLVNDRVDIAAAVDADGVHLGDEDLPVAAARDVLGDEAIVGRSVSSVAAARRAVQAGADYLGVGAVYATDSKDVREEHAEIGPDTVAAIADAVDVPIVGIGGITAANAGDVIEAGADGVAVVSAITAADDPEAATRELADAVRAAGERP